MATAAEVRAVVQAVIRTAAGGPPVIWRYQDAPQPQLDYVDLAFGVSTPEGYDYVAEEWATDEQSASLRVAGVREQALELQAWSAATVEDDARATAAALLERVAVRLRLPAARAALAEAGVSVIEPGPVLWQPSVVAAGFRGRATCSVRLRVPVASPAGIETAERVRSVEVVASVAGMAATGALVCGPVAASSSNAFPLPYRNPNGDFFAEAVFGESWNGGSVMVSGYDATGTAVAEVLAAAPGDVTTGAQPFAVVSAVVCPSAPSGLTQGTVALRAASGGPLILLPSRAEGGQFQGALRQPRGSYRVTVTFRGAWDGGHVRVGGLLEDPTAWGSPAVPVEDFAPPPGGEGVVVGTFRWAAVLSVTKVADEANPAAVGTRGTAEVGVADVNEYIRAAP